jgi:hypothetical protein
LASAHRFESWRLTQTISDRPVNAVKTRYPYATQRLARRLSANRNLEISGPIRAALDAKNIDNALVVAGTLEK